MGRARQRLAACALTVIGALLAVPAVQAQPAKPLESDAAKADQARLVQQQRVTARHREMQQAAFEAKLAEQDVVSTQDTYTATSKRAEALKAELDKAIKARDAARAKEAAARKRYDEALQSVPR